MFKIAIRLPHARYSRSFYPKGFADMNSIQTRASSDFQLAVSESPEWIIVETPIEDLSQYEINSKEVDGVAIFEEVVPLQKNSVHVTLKTDDYLTLVVFDTQQYFAREGKNWVRTYWNYEKQKFQSTPFTKKYNGVSGTYE